MKPEDTRELIENCGGKDVTYVGTRTSILGAERNVYIEDRHRVKHALTTGVNGTGKTHELLHVALQDSVKGRGLALFNSKGTLVDQFLAKVPENRYSDLVYVNPYREPIIGINVLEPYLDRTAPIAAKTNQIELIVSNLIQLFKRLSNNWGDRFGRVLATMLRAGIEANIEYSAGYTLIDIKHCVTDNEELKQLIEDTADPELRSQLVSIKDNLSDSQLEPLVRRLNDFTENKTVRHIVGSENSDIGFQEVIDQQKILLVDVREGEVGSTVTRLLSSIVITKLWAAAQKRYYQDREIDQPFTLFVDELQSYPGEGPQFTEILSKAREYRLGCWLVTQYLSQLPTEMRNAVKTNCRTKLVFDPTGSDDIPKLAKMLRGTDQEQLEALGDYRAIVQAPATRKRNKAITVDTYPPWNTGDIDIDQLKADATPASETDTLYQKPVTGKGANAGGEKHTELLSRAEKRLEERGFQVKILYQDTGDDKPDGKVILPDGDIAHLEAEHSTLTKPGKVLRNLQRAVEEDRECIFVVEQGKAAKLQNIITDPVNRRGNEHEDPDGSYSYYSGEDGEFTETEILQNGEYRIIEIQEDTIEIHNDTVEPECPELETQSEEELEGFCLYREEDGHCTALGQQCTLLSDD